MRYRDQRYFLHRARLRDCAFKRLLAAEIGERFVAQKFYLQDRRYCRVASDRRTSRARPIRSRRRRCPCLSASAGRPTQERARDLDANHDGIYSCDEWKSYLDRIFTSADRNRDGNLDPSEFATVRRADAALADADFGYFDEDQDGKITRKEFVEKPSAFILRFDRNGDCRVTPDEIRATNAPKGPQGPPVRERDRFH
jgi:hypothetical protein